jgi:hypothetical protein
MIPTRLWVIMLLGVITFSIGLFLVMIAAFTFSLPTFVGRCAVISIGGLYVPLRYIQNGED